jgi:hypothetical protein
MQPIIYSTYALNIVFRLLNKYSSNKIVAICEAQFENKIRQEQKRSHFIHIYQSGGGGISSM